MKTDVLMLVLMSYEVKSLKLTQGRDEKTTNREPNSLCADKSWEDLRAIDIHRDVYASSVKGYEEVDKQDTNGITSFTSTVSIFSYHDCLDCNANCTSDLDRVLA